MNFKIKHIHQFNIGTVWGNTPRGNQLTIQKTSEKETVGNFMQRVLKWNLIAEIFTRMKHRIMKWFSSARYRVLCDIFKRNNSQEWKKTHSDRPKCRVAIVETRVSVFSDSGLRRTTNLALPSTERFLFSNKTALCNGLQHTQSRYKHVIPLTRGMKTKRQKYLACMNRRVLFVRRMEKIRTAISPTFLDS